MVEQVSNEAGKADLESLSGFWELMIWNGLFVSEHTSRASSLYTASWAASFKNNKQGNQSGISFAFQ